MRGFQKISRSNKNGTLPLLSPHGFFFCVCFLGLFCFESNSVNTLFLIDGSNDWVLVLGSDHLVISVGQTIENNSLLSKR